LPHPARRHFEHAAQKKKALKAWALALTINGIADEQ
jgi:hypothetical protein